MSTIDLCPLFDDRTYTVLQSHLFELACDTDQWKKALEVWDFLRPHRHERQETMPNIIPPEGSS